jgi:hypothetical protein
MPGHGRAGGSVRVVISAEASAYMAWQAKLAHYSCLSRLGQAPLVVVHERGYEEIPDLTDIVRTGGTVLHAPSYRTTSRGFRYSARNSAGTLLEAARATESGAEWLVLCDADVVFTRRTRFGRSLSGAACTYLDYNEGPVRAAMRRLGISARDVARSGATLHCGIPYVIRRAQAAALARAWLEAIDAFVPPRWEDVMHAFGLAALGLGLRVRHNQLADTNYWPRAPVRAPIVHYCYDNAAWSKRRFASPRAARRVWAPPPGAQPGTVLGEVFRQLREAHVFFEGAAHRVAVANTAGESNPTPLPSTVRNGRSPVSDSRRMVSIRPSSRTTPTM